MTDVEELLEVNDSRSTQTGRLPNSSNSNINLTNEHRSRIAPWITSLCTVATVLYVLTASFLFIFLQVYQSNYVRIRWGLGYDAVNNMVGFSVLITLLGWLLGHLVAVLWLEKYKENFSYRCLVYLGMWTATMIAAEILQMALFALCLLFAALWEWLILVTGSAEVMSS